MPENVVKVTAQECKKPSSSQRASLKNVVAYAPFVFSSY